MNWVAWKMLNGDPIKYLGTVFGVAFGVLLIAQQCSIFVGIISRTANPIADVRENIVWAMDPYSQNADEIKPLSDSDVYRIRGITGVDWAVKFFKGTARAKVESGMFKQVIMMGIDDHSMVGAPAKIIHGSLADLRRPDSIIMDEAGYRLLWPGEPIRLNRVLEMNDHRAIIVAICDAAAPFQTFPIVYTRYSQAVQFVASERQQLSFVVAGVKPNHNVADVCRTIDNTTDMRAMGHGDFVWFIIQYYLKYTGIPVNFGITIALGFIVGTAITGQTFYLFTVENLKQFGALKAMGVTNWRLIGMILLQAGIVGVVGFGLGMGMTAAFFEVTNRVLPDLRGLHLPWQIAAGTGVAVTGIILLTAIVSMRKVLMLEPAVVFRG